MSGPLSLGRITAALTTVHNENSASLANVNFDFTLFKLEAPAEYNGLGATISRKRKADAEEGALHRTARKLGALFAGILPPTDELFRAYGTRVSEISSMPDINPSEGGGIFAGHVGADTASIWAAVTSGSSAIAAHLLGCMLARIFTGPEAVSAWVELVQKQKERIRNKKGESLYSQEQEAEYTASQQDISRADLANWDASARAWLQSADQAKELQHKQTMLILNNASVPVNNEPEIYASVTKAWTVALEAMDNLIRGIPQRVQDGAALLAISSWHLYPDMIVYPSLDSPGVPVKQKDPLFEPAALLTLGLQHVRDDTKSVYWSLPLAHLQHYGHPIRASRTVGQENSRVSYHQFAYIILGCLLVGWRDFAQTDKQGLLWLQKIGSTLRLRTTPDFHYNSQSSIHPKVVSEEVGLERTNSAEAPIWLEYLLTTAGQLKDCEDSERKVALQLMKLGQRRSSFLHANHQGSSPLFGLAQVTILLSVLKSDLQQVHLLREVCDQLKLEGSQFLIRYISSTEEGRTEYASVMPVQRNPPKRMHDGTVKDAQTSGPKHVRWLTLSSIQLSICIQRSEDLKNVERSMETLSNLEEIEQKDLSARSKDNFHGFGLGQDQGVTPKRQKRLDDIRELKELVYIAQRQQAIEKIGELCLPVAQWDIDPQHGFHERGLIFSLECDFLSAAQDLLQKVGSAWEKPVAISKTFYAGDEDVAAIYSITPVRMIAAPAPKCLGHRKLTLDSKHLEKLLVADNFDTDKLYRHFSSLSGIDQAAADEVRNIKACAVMADIYKLLPGATISTLVVNQSLSRAKWIPVSHHYITRDLLTLPQVFACVAMFESGTCNLDPGTLLEAFAMSSGNSLYVAGALLCDPFEQPKSTELRRVVGNVGRAGITFLICPPEVKIREPDPEKWMAINHDVFDGNLEDHFQQTSIHLSFTEYEIPLITEDNPRHIIDRAVLLVETLISVFEGATWVAEVDILKAFRSPVYRTLKDLRCVVHGGFDSSKQPICYEQALRQHPKLAATSVENWDELIEAPCTGIIVVRAYKNWLARLAATAICIKHGFIPVILPEEPCWSCCAKILAVISDGKIALIC